MKDDPKKKKKKKNRIPNIRHALQNRDMDIGSSLIYCELERIMSLLTCEPFLFSIPSHIPSESKAMD